MEELMNLFLRFRKKFENKEINPGDILHDFLDKLVLDKKDFKDLKSAVNEFFDKKMVNTSIYKLSMASLMVEKNLTEAQIDLVSYEDSMKIYEVFLNKVKLYIGFSINQIGINEKIKLIDDDESFDYIYTS